MKKQGKLIVIEGIDGSGKNTQAKKMIELLEGKGFSVGSISFPDYQSFFGKEIGNYLNGEFGELKNLHPKLIAMLYSNDRLLSKGKIEHLIENNDYLICDRYTSSNLGHQVSKFKDPAERNAMIDWIMQLEYGEFKLPQPNATIFLDIPPFLTSDLILKKDTRNYTDKKKDLHEADKNHLTDSYNTYILLAEKLDNWHKLPCVKDGEIQSIDEISKNLLELILSID